MEPQAVIVEGVFEGDEVLEVSRRRQVGLEDLVAGACRSRSDTAEGHVYLKLGGRVDGDDGVDRRDRAEAELKPDERAIPVGVRPSDELRVDLRRRETCGVDIGRDELALA